MHVVKILRDKLTLNSDSVFFSSCKCLFIEDFSIFPSFQIFVITGNYCALSIRTLWKQQRT